MNSLSYHYSLQNAENYNALLENSLTEIVERYILLICEYLRFIVENIKMKNKGYFKFILIRGLETITHVFKNTLYYTKNLEMAYYHGQKSFYYYVEFIGQISEEQHQYLQLSSRDATMYVYKKTLFEITNECKKHSTYVDKELEKKLDGTTLHIQIYKNIIQYFLGSEKNLCDERFSLFTKKFESLCNKLNTLVLSNEDLKVIELFHQNITAKYFQTEKFFEIQDIFMMRVFKKKSLLSEKKIKQKLVDDSFNETLEQTPEKFVNWIIS
jgi:hypothetical protein